MIESESKLIKTETHIVPDMEERVRLSDYYRPNIFNTIQSRKAMKNAIKNGLIKVNGDVGYTGDYILGGETIDVFQNPIQKHKPSIDLNIEVLYEDDYLAIVNKPPGIVVSGNKSWTLENALSQNLKKSSQKDALHRAEPIHRLDYPTSGALLIGKTALMVMTLNKLFEDRKIDKIYFAVTIGSIKDSGIIETLIDQKPAKTEFSVLQKVKSPKYQFLNLTELKPHTGRRHQLRIHMASIGNPIFGDLLYGKEGLILKGRGLYLHASSLKLIHPITNEQLFITAPLPKKYHQLFSNI